MAESALVGFVVESLGKLVIEEAKFLAGVSEEVDELQVEVHRLQSLRDAQARKNEKRDIQVWIAQSKDLAYEAEYLLEEYAFRISSHRENLFKRMFCFLSECYVRQSIGSEIRNLKKRISGITRSFQEYGITSFLNEREDSSSSLQQLRRTYSFIADDDFIKLDNDVEKLVGHLVNENDHDDARKIVSIVGMGGLGKTTLARKIYNHLKIQSYFDNLAWVYISQHWQKRDILEDILIKCFTDKREEIMKLSDAELMSKLSETFGNKKCFFVLDDIWSIEFWEIIKEAFPLRKSKSKILLTTRKRNVALHLGPDGFHHEPRLLNDQESWELLQIKALVEDRQIVDEQLCKMKELGKEMVKYCGGLPLAVVVLGGILATKRGIEEWKIVHKNVKEHIGRGKDLMQEQGEVEKILALSYDDLPLKLKPIFVYLGRFPEDYEIKVERLYQLWIAEGMISTKDVIGDESMMDVAERYLRELAERFLVQVVVDEDMIRMTRFKYCRLHDLIREHICLEKAKEENLFSLVHSQNGFDDQVHKSSSPTNEIHRLVIHLKKNDFMKYVPPQKRATKHLRSLSLVFDEFLYYQGSLAPTIFSQISRFRMLRSLEIIGEVNIGYSRDRSCLNDIDSLKFPEGISSLNHLRYLSLQGDIFFYLPSSFGNLKQLQTLDLQHFNFLQIPNIIRKMKQLRHLYLPRDWETFACDKLRFDGLNKLEILEKFDSGKCCFGDLVKLTNLRWLKACVNVKDGNLVETLMLLLDSKNSVKMNMEIIIPENDKLCITEEECSIILNKLFYCEKILKLQINMRIGTLPKYESDLAIHLVDLSLVNSKLEDDSMETLGKLPKLKYLSLWSDSYLGTEMNFYSYSFFQLRRLYLGGLPNLNELIIAEGAMPNLLELDIRRCENLEMIPDGLRFIKTLKVLDVYSMPEKFNSRIQVINGQEGEDYYKIRHVPMVKVW